MTCKFSLIIPVYQVKDYIVQCLESIFCQIPPDVQVILVDDGSTDGSGEICDEYAKKYPQIEVIHQKNKGVAAARNAGLDAAKGEYLLWVDPDDWVSERWFLEIERAVDFYAPDVIVFDSIRIGNKSRRKEVYGRASGFVDKEVFCCDLARDIRMLSGFPNKVMRRSLYSGIRFDCSLGILEDYEMIFAVLKNAQKIYYIQNTLYFYRQHDTSLLHQREPEKSFLCVQIAERRREMLDNRYKQAAEVGVVIQAFLYCRASAYDSRYTLDSERYQYCKQLIHRHIRAMLRDKEIPFIWKIKFLFMDKSVLNYIVKVKHMIGCFLSTEIL